MNRHKIFNGLALTLSIVIVLSPMTALSGCKEKGALGSEAQSLARYMPADTALFASIQVSDEAIDVLDGLLGRVAEALPPDSLPPGLLSVRSVFEQGVASLGYDYETDIRSWLGDWVAVGVGDVSVLDDDWMLDPNLPNVIAISVTDRGKAEAFIDRLLADSGADRELQKTTEGDFTAYRSPSPDQPAAILLGDEVLLLGTSAGLTAATGDGDTLIDAAAFADTMDLLQASSYNMLVYLDTGLLTNLIAADLDSTSEPATAPIVGAIIGALGPTATQSPNQERISVS